MQDLIELNGLCYCKCHVRDICHACTFDFQSVNEAAGFEIPENGQPEYPTVHTHSRDHEVKDLLARRWLNMQRQLYPAQNLSSRALTPHRIRFLPVEMPDDLKGSLIARQAILLRLFQQLQGMASSQRYYFANQSRIILQDYETFSAATVLYEEELVDITSRLFDLLALRGEDLASSLGRLRVRSATEQKAKASLLNAFGFFLELKTHRTFWQTMEFTAEAFSQHVQTFREEADGETVLTDKAKAVLLQWIGHMFWSLQHAQFRLNRLHNIQREVYQRGDYPFYPYSRNALEANLDVHVIIIKLSKAHLYDIGSDSSLLNELQESSKFPEQMEFVNAEIMAAIDEFSTRFRVLEILLRAAHLVASQKEIRKALLAYSFDSEGLEINSKMDDIFFLLTGVHEGEHRTRTPGTTSFLQKLIIKENAFRKQYSDKMSSAQSFSSDSSLFTRDMFDAFKLGYLSLYRQYIRPQWKENEYSLLSIDIVKRAQHRHDVEKEKKREKKKRPLSEAEDEMAEIAKARAVPESAFGDPSLFWEIGDGSLEPYVPPTVRKKMKTRKLDSMDIVPEEVATSVEEDQAPSVPSLPRPLDRLKEADLVTRDILWCKQKGTLKWSSMMQFLSHLGCSILNLDGSKKKVIDSHTGLCTVLHMPHPGDTCRPDQCESYRLHIEDWLKIRYEDLVRPDCKPEGTEISHLESLDEV